jgi:signal peptidase I
LVSLGIGVMMVQTWFVEGLFGPVVVPSGSMATTLLGVHRDVVCADCGHRFAYGTDQRLLAGVTVCPNCGSTTTEATELPELPGERVLIDRATLGWRDPQRWEVVAFRHPRDARMICVKRVAGLPGEEVQIREGDLYIDGQIQRKTLEQQRAQAVLVHDANHEPVSSKALPRCWQGESGSRWQVSGGRFLHPSGGEAMDWCVYHHWQWEPGRLDRACETAVSDDLPYNRAWPRHVEEIRPVGDLILSFRVVQAEGRGRLAVRARAGEREFLLTIDPLGGSYEVRADGVLVGEKGAVSICRQREQGSRWEVSVVDRQFLVAVDGRPLVTYAYEMADGKAVGSGTGRFSIGCQGLQVEIRDVRVDRDVYYTRPPGVEARWGFDRPYRLGADEYFVLGDNSPISEDSRVWCGGPGVPRKLLYGRPFLVHFSSRSHPCFGGRVVCPDPTQIRLIR